MDRAATIKQEVTQLGLDRLLIRPELQVRVSGLDRDHVRLLAEDPDAWPPLQAVEIGGQLVLIDGAHRYAAAQELGLKSVPVEILEVTDDGDLRKMAWEANRRHGRPLSLADRRNEAERILRVTPAVSNLEIHDRVGLAPTTIATIRERLEKAGLVEGSERRVSRAGVEYTPIAPTRKPGELPPPSLVETIRQGFSAKDRREQRAVASYLERLAVALEDNLKLAAWDTDEEAAEACRAVLGPEKAQALGKRLYLSRDIYQVSCLLQAVEE